jgi:hypothetical protein
MKRLLLAFLVLWGATLVFPGMKEGVRSRAGDIGAWTGARLAGPLSPITNRYRVVQAENQLSKTSRLLTLQRNQGQRAPEPHELPAYLTRHEIAPGGSDPWGTPYRIVQEADSVAIMSAGADRLFGTRDDLVVRVRFPRSPTRPFRN